MQTTESTNNTPPTVEGVDSDEFTPSINNKKKESKKGPESQLFRGPSQLDARKQMLLSQNLAQSARSLGGGGGEGGQFHDRSLEWVEINDDVYNMFFLSNIGGQAFWYAIYIFILKLALYTFLARDALDLEDPSNVSEQVRITQFFMLPVAVAMQDDLIATYYLVANIKYSKLIQKECPDASNIKFHMANLCRGIDGMFSLFVNFIILMRATEVLSLFLNFAALQFLQTLDNIALRLCAEGYLTDRLEVVANQVMTIKLPNRNNEFLRSLDSVLFLSTFTALLIGWGVISFG